VQKTQTIFIKLDFTLRKNGGYGYDGHIGPNVDKTSTQFGGARPKFEDGDLEEHILRYNRELTELYPDRPVVVKLRIEDERG